MPYNIGVNRSFPKKYFHHLNAELATAVLIVLSVLFLYIYETHHTYQKSRESLTNSIGGNYSTIHDVFYSINHDKLESRFPFRKKNDPLAYIRQVFIVFGGATLAMLLFAKVNHLSKSLNDVTNWDISILCCTLNLIFSYVFGFVAVFNDWWFFFPDLITGDIWQIRKGQMVLGDVLFYPMAVIMGHTGVLVVKRMHNPFHNTQTDNLLKNLWFTIAFAIILWGFFFGLSVMKGMIYYLYIPFCTIGLLLYHRYTGFELWMVTWLFIICEFLWDLVARVKGIWIFPDSSTHPGLYLNEIVFCHIGQYPLVWQPEMTQMAFASGVISLVFYHMARCILRKEYIVKK